MNRQMERAWSRRSGAAILGPMRGTPSSARAAVLIAAAALAVHELRYLVAPAHGGAHAGHSYLPLAHLLIALALAGACVQLGALALRARRSGRLERSGVGFSCGWAFAALAVLAVYTGQELLEGALADGRVAGLVAVFGAGGWVAAPLALVAGALVALSMGGARAVIAAAARREPGPGAPLRHTHSGRRLASARRRTSCELAEHLAGRAPPLAR